MRRLVVSIVLASGLVLIGAGSASAEPATTAAPAKAVAGKKVCKVTDPLLDELSGIVATKNGFVVINDSSPLDSHKRVFFLNDDCDITERVSFTGGGPRDTEDLVLSPDGKTLWIADIGDNARERGTIGVWTMPADGSRRPRIHRFSYPPGDKHDAEALLLNGDGTPIIVTKEIGKPAGVYVPTAPMKTENAEGVPLKRAGEITVPPSSTSGNAIARIGRATIDGGAVAPGGERVALRTYTDALEWTVTGGDVLAALQGKPRVTPLPDEPQGEAITYSADGKNFYTVSDLQGETADAQNHILRYAPTAPAVTARSAVTAADTADGPSWYANLSISDITYLVGGVGVLGAILVGVGIFGIMRSRKRRPSAGDPLKPKPVDPSGQLIGVSGASGGRATYSGPGRPSASSGRPSTSPSSRPAASPSGAVYGGKAKPPPTPPSAGRSGTQRGSGVYGAPGAARPGPEGDRGRPRSGGSGGSGVYGAPPPQPPARGGRREPGGRGSSPRGGDQRPSGYFGRGDEPYSGGSNSYGSDPTRDYDNPGYGRGR